MKGRWRTEKGWWEMKIRENSQRQFFRLKVIRIFDLLLPP